jgi:hypothetical protein
MIGARLGRNPRRVSLAPSAGSKVSRPGTRCSVFGNHHSPNSSSSSVGTARSYDDARTCDAQAMCSDAAMRVGENIDPLSKPSPTLAFATIQFGATAACALSAIVPEIVYDKDQLSVDWFVIFDDLVVLVEVKSTRMSHLTRMGGNKLIDDIERCSMSATLMC